MTVDGVLALDLGTSTSAAAVVSGDRTTLVKEPSGESWVWPSVVARDGDRLVVGVRAEHRRRSRPENARIEFKRDLGVAAPLVLGGASYRPEELSTALIAAVKAAAERLYGGPLTRAVLTCPASYGRGDPRRNLLIAAGEAAGLVAGDLLAEPVAAALAPIAGPPFVAGDTVLVYDFGGGTFDAAVVRLAADGRHQVLGHAALDDCGGRDIDVLVHREVLAVGGQPLADWLDRDPAAQLRNTVELTEFARVLKRRLSVEEDAEAYFPPADLLLELKRERLAALIGPLLEATVDCCRALLRKCEMPADDLTAVLLTGGTSRIPAVAETVAKAFGDRIRTVEDPELAVAQGAAAWTRSRPERFSVPALPGPEIQPLSWDLPGGSASLLRWEVAVGDEVDAGAVLALTRLPEGELWELRSRDRPGRIRQLHAVAGRQIFSGDWLVTLEPGAAEPGPTAVCTFEPADRVVLAPRGAHVAVMTGSELTFRTLDGGDAVEWTVRDVSPGAPVVFDPRGRSLTYWARAHAGAAAVKLADGTPLWAVNFVGRRCLALAANESTEVIAAAVAEAHSITVWRLQPHATRPRSGVSIPGGAADVVVFSPDGELLAVSLPDGPYVMVFNAVAEEKYPRMRMTVQAQTLTFGPDHELVTAEDGVVRCYDVGREECVAEYRDAEGSDLARLCVSADGQWIAAASTAGYAWVWNLREFHEARELTVEQGVQDLLFTPDGSALLLATDRTVCRYELNR
jgi:hypothetical protein